jgi:hypothetical protein
MAKATLRLTEQIREMLLSDKGLDVAKLDEVLSSLVVTSDERVVIKRYLAGQTEDPGPNQVLVLRFTCPGLLAAWIQEVGAAHSLAFSGVEPMEVKHQMQDILEASIQFALYIFSTCSAQGDGSFGGELHQRVTHGKRLNYRLEQVHDLFLGHALELEGFFAYLEHAYPKLARKVPTKEPVVIKAPEGLDEPMESSFFLSEEKEMEVVVPLNAGLVLWVLFWAVRWNTSAQEILVACLNVARFVYSHALKAPGDRLGTFREELLLRYTTIKRRRARVLRVVEALEKAFVEDQATDRFNMEAVKSLLSSGRASVIARRQLHPHLREA